MDDLRTALFSSDFNKIAELVQQDASWNLDSFMTGQTIEKLINSENFDLLKLLIEKDIVSLDVFEYDSFNNSIFEILLSANFSENLKSFFNEIIEDIENIDEELEGKNWLELAIENNASAEILELIIEGGCDINTIDAYEKTYLHKTKNVALTEFFINQGLDINKQDITGKTPFWNAVTSKNKDLIQRYLDNGVDVNMQDKQGETIYDVICFQLQDADLLKYIAEYDPPNLDLTNKKEQSLFFRLANLNAFGSETKMIELLLDYGTDVFKEELDDYGKPVSAADIMAKKSIEYFEMLDSKGFLDVDLIDNKGNTWLHKVCKINLNFEETKAKEMYKKVKFLLKKGANPALKNDEDKSAIDYAQEDNLKAKVLSLLLKNN